ncbi:MAG: hypothetical protein ACKO5J_14515 [Rubrivivax sp.]
MAWASIEHAAIGPGRARRWGIGQLASPATRRALPKRRETPAS